jgi:hypothetical protein
MLHNLPTESNELCTSPGNMCALLAYWGKASSKKSLVCGDCINVPLGILTLSAICDDCLLVNDDVADMKLLVPDINPLITS